MRSAIIFAFVLIASAVAEKSTRILEESNSTCACDADIQDLRSQVSTLKGQLENLNGLAREIFPDVYCGVGIKDGRIPDSAFNASSYHTPLVAPSKARLDGPSFWHPDYPPSVFDGEWWQVDLSEPTRIVGLITQGRTTPYIPQWLKSFYICYGNSTTDPLLFIQEPSGRNLLFRGNTDSHSHKVNRFPEAITARYFRIVVQTYHYAPCLRTEFLVC